MKTTVSKSRPKKPLVIKGRNASGKIIEAYIPAGVRPRKDPIMAIANNLKKYPGIKPTPINNAE